MKYKILLPFIAISLILGLSSCNKNPNVVENNDKEQTNEIDNTNSITNGENETSNNQTEANPTLSPEINITYDDKPSVSTAIESAVEKIYDSVVSITALKQTSTSAGSGVIFAKNEELNLSYIVTCFHVIDGTNSLKVTYNLGSEKKEIKAYLVGAYSDNDIAILAIEGTNYTYASFYDDTDKLKLGSTVIAIGNPLGTLPGTVSTGVVSFVNRNITIDSQTGRSIDLIQTDVAINSGNSGGGLFNSNGNLIGIVNGKYSSFEGLSFAIPVNTVRNVISSINSTAKYDKENKVFSVGYFIGDWKLGFGVSNFVTFSYKRVVGISTLSINDTTSGSNLFEYQEIIKAVAIDFKDENKNDIKAQDITSAEAFYSLIYNSNLSIGDKIIITNSNDEIKTVELIQYIYS